MTTPAGAVEIHQGDNLAVIRGFEAGSFTLVYLDPPFNTGRMRERAVETARPPSQSDDVIVRRGFHGRDYERDRKSVV